MYFNIMINIGGHDYTMDEVEQVFQMANELIKANETLNAQLIACMAKLGNEEKKVAGLKLQLFQLMTQTQNYDKGN